MGFEPLKLLSASSMPPMTDGGFVVIGGDDDDVDDDDGGDGDESERAVRCCAKRRGEFESLVSPTAECFAYPVTTWWRFPGPVRASALLMAGLFMFSVTYDMGWSQKGWPGVEANHALGSDCEDVGSVPMRPMKACPPG